MSSVALGPSSILATQHIYHHFQDHAKIHETDPQVTSEQIFMTPYTLRLTMILNMDCLKMLLMAIILIVRSGMIFNVPTLATHMTPQPVHCIQTHPVHTQMIIFHNNLTP